MSKIRATTLRAPDSLLKIIKQAAELEGHTLNSLILQILWDWAKRNKKDQDSAREERQTS